MPTESFGKDFMALKQITGKLTRRLVILLAHQYGVSREAAVRRLEGIGLAPKGSWDWFIENGGITNEQAKSVLGEAAFATHEPATIDAISNRTILMLKAAWSRNLMSQNQIEELFQIDTKEILKIWVGFESEIEKELD